MQLRTCLLSAFTLSTVLSFGIAAIAGDLPKEGALKGTYFSFGTAKAVPIGKEKLLIAWEENGLQLTDGFLDHVTWHCWGTGDYVNGMGQDRGNCVGTDPSGDQEVFSTDDEKHSPDQKVVSGTFTYTAGTGKYAGISGGGKWTGHAGEFRPAAEGTYFQYVTFQGSYKLQPLTQ